MSKKNRTNNQFTNQSGKSYLFLVGKKAPSLYKGGAF